MHVYPEGYRLRVWCSKCNAGHVSVLYNTAAITTHRAQSRERERLRGMGWTFWVGHSSRAYCPRCKPNPGHKMHEVTS